MSNNDPTYYFTGKTWTYIAQALLFGGLGIFSVSYGLLALFDLVKDIKGQSVTVAAAPLLIIGSLLIMAFALATFNILARRRPVLYICREGLIVNKIGSSSLDGVPLLPGLIRVAWLVISFQGFKQQIVLAFWQSIQSAEVSGPPMARTLTIFGSFIPPESAQAERPESVADQIAFPEVAFTSPLDRIAETINEYSQNPESRNRLPSWKK